MQTPQDSPETPDRRIQARGYESPPLDAPILRLFPAADKEPGTRSIEGMRELGSLLLSTDFTQSFVDAQLAQILRAREILQRRISDRLIFPLQVKAARSQLERADKKAVKRLARESTTVIFQGREFDIARSPDLISLRRTLLDGNAHYKKLNDDNIRAAETLRSAAHATARRLIEDFSALTDPTALLSALELWGRSRNAAGDRNHGHGYHAGVVHYFEYRTVAGKNRRFVDNSYSECSLQNFIDVSESFRPFIRSSPEKAAALAHSYISINDNNDQRRVFIRTDSALLIGFQREKQPLRLLSFIPNKPGWEEREDTAGRIEKELAAEGIDTRFNRLGLERSVERFNSQ